MGFLKKRRIKMISFDTNDIYVIYSKSSSGIAYHGNVFVRKEDAEERAEELREVVRKTESKYLPEGSNLFTKYFVDTLEDFLSVYEEYKRWEGENGGRN
jgi:pyruvate/oxaloacetate carboxyltransferase